MDPVLFKIGPIVIRWYGFLVIGGAVAAAYLASREAKRRGEDPELIWDMLIWVLFTGIVGARLYHVFSTPAGGQLGWPYYKMHPLDAFKIWNGGLAIYGALLGGFFGVVTYVWRRHANLVVWLDIITPTVLLAQAIGRWGNFFNQEVYGYPTNLPWKLYIPPANRLPGYEQYEYYHPLFLYESIACLIGFLLIYYFINRKFAKKLLPGDLFSLYFVWYPLVRFFTESLRPDAWKLGSLPTAQLISIVAFVLAVLVITLRHTVWRPKNTLPA